MKSHITNIALDMVYESGLINLSRRELCERAGIPNGSFPHYMGESFTEFVARIRKVTETDTEKHYPVIKTRANPELRRDQILKVAVDLSIKNGYNNIRRDDIAEAAGVSEGLVTNYFNTMTQLRRDIIRYAIKHDLAEIVKQGIANGDNHAKKAPTYLKIRAANLIAES